MVKQQQYDLRAAGRADQSVHAARRRRAGIGAVLLLAGSAADAATVTLDWVQTYSTLGTATTSSGVLTFTDPGLGSVANPATYSGTIAAPSAVTFTFTENGHTVTASPSLAGLTITNGILAPFTDGLSMGSITTSVLPLAFSVTASGTGLGSLGPLQTAANSLGLGSAWSSYLGSANEVAGNGSVTINGTGTLTPPSFTGSVTASGAGSAGYLGYWQVVAAPVPVPAAAWLLGSGVLGLATLARRRPVAHAA